MARTAADNLEQMRRKMASQKHLLDKLKAIRALHMVTYTSQTQIEKLAIEYYYAIGDILEGQTPLELKLSVINKEEFLKEVTDG